MTTLLDAFKDSYAQVFFLIKMDFDGLILRYTTSPSAIQVDSAELYLPGILSNITIKSTFDIRTFKYSIGNLQITIENSSRLQENELNRVLENGECTIYLYSPGVTIEDMENNGVLFIGSFKKQSHTKNNYVFDVAGRIKDNVEQIPTSVIDTDTWPNHRTTSDGGGSIAGSPQPLIFGEWPNASVELLPVDTSAYKYLATIGTIESTDADYTAATVNVYDDAGSVIGAANYTMEYVSDGENNRVVIFNFTSDQTSSEPLSCSIEGIYAENIGNDDSKMLNRPGEICKYLISRYSNLSVDKASLATMQTTRTQFYYSTYINSFIDGIDVLDRLFTQCFSARYLHSNGNFGCVTFDLNGSIIKKIDLNTESVNQNGISISQTFEDLVTNDLLLQYAYNPVTRKYAKTKRFYFKNNTQCYDSYYKYGQQPQRVVQLTDIQNDSTALNYGSLYLDIYSQKHYILSAVLPHYMAYGLKEFDNVELTTDVGITQVGSDAGTGWENEKFIILDRNITDNGVKFRFWKITV